MNNIKSILTLAFFLATFSVAQGEGVANKKPFAQLQGEIDLLKGQIGVLEGTVANNVGTIADLNNQLEIMADQIDYLSQPLSLETIFTTNSERVEPGERKAIIAYCPIGYEVTGGGWFYDRTDTVIWGVTLNFSRSITNTAILPTRQTGWIIHVEHSLAGVPIKSLKVEVYAQCIRLLQNSYPDS